MSKIYTDNEIKAKLEGIRYKDINVSPEFHNTIEETLDSLPFKKKAKVSIGKKSMMAAAIIVLCIVTIGVINPAFAENIPFVGTVFKQLASKNTENVTNEKYAVGIGQTQKDKGLSITVDEAVFDGSRLIVGYTIKSDKPLSNTSGEPFITRDIEVDFNGQKMRMAGGEKYGEFKGQDTYIGVSKWDLSSEVATMTDEAKVSLYFHRVNFGEDLFVGDWNYRFSVDTSKTAPDVKVIQSNFVYKDDIGDLKILKCTISPLAVSIFYEAPQEPIVNGYTTGEYNYLNTCTWDVLDDKGNKLTCESQRILNGEEIAKASCKNKLIPDQWVIKFLKVNPDTEYITIKTSKFETKILLK